MNSIRCILEERDLVELLDFSEDLETYFYHAKTNGITFDFIVKIRAFFNFISMSLSKYIDLSFISEIIKEMSYIFTLYTEKIMYLTYSQIEILEGFSHNFSSFIDKSFNKKEDDIHSLDNSFIADLETIKSILDDNYKYLNEDDCIFF